MKYLIQIKQTFHFSTSTCIYDLFNRDLAKMDKEGFCQIVGRNKDMIIRGGENIYPLEIEQILYKHPDVKDVQVC